MVMAENRKGPWDVVETVEATERTIGGKTLPVTITRRVGLCEYIDPDGKPFLADEAVFSDFGPKLGIRRTYVMHPEVEPTEEERRAGRERLLEITAQAITDQGLWNKIGRPA